MSSFNILTMLTDNLFFTQCLSDFLNGTWCCAFWSPGGDDNQFDELCCDLFLTRRQTWSIHDTHSCDGNTLSSHDCALM